MRLALSKDTKEMRECVRPTGISGTGLWVTREVGWDGNALKGTGNGRAGALKCKNVPLGVVRPAFGHKGMLNEEPGLPLSGTVKGHPPLSTPGQDLSEGMRPTPNIVPEAQELDVPALQRFRQQCWLHPVLPTFFRKNEVVSQECPISEEGARPRVTGQDANPERALGEVALSLPE